MMTEFFTWKKRRAAHKNLPRWLCVFLACEYADSVTQGPEGRTAIDTARLWLRGKATTEACKEAASAASNAATATNAALNAAYAAYAAAAASYAATYAATAATAAISATAALNAAYTADAATYASNAPCEAIYDETLRVLTKRFGDTYLSDAAQQVALDWLEECGMFELEVVASG